MNIGLTKRQNTIIEIVRGEGPITGEQIAERLHLSRATLRPDLAILVMSGVLEARPRVGYYYAGKTGLSLVGEEIRKLKVRDVQSVPVVVQENSSVYDTIVTMFLEDVGTVFVVQHGGVLVGLVSRKDLLKNAMGNADLQKIPVKVVMTRMPNIITTTPEEPAWMAAKKIIDREIDGLPVVREMEHTSHISEGAKAYEVVGRITKTNITRLFVEMGEK
jgi:DeoR family transcriptional regulator, catabolite repression regulator